MQPIINSIHRVFKRLGYTRLGAWLFARILHHLDRSLLRLSANKVSITELITGLPIITLITTGAKSRSKRVIPIVGIPNGEDIILIASNFGEINQPAWYYNLRARPQATILLDGKDLQFKAIEVQGAERARLWGIALSYYSGFAVYENFAAPRRIPVILLTPKKNL